ncbi:MAG: hypothetical protein VYC34_04550, partial [Planctomycetota bacterium]|nr:hypothetical protein [Planctomycetota bacterium]
LLTALRAATQGDDESVSLIRPSELARSGADSFDAFIISDADLDEPALRAIETAVLDATPLLWILDSAPSASSAARYNQLAGADARLPLEPSAPFSMNRREPLTVRAVDITSDPLALFQGPAAAEFERLTFSRFTPTELSRGASILIEGADDPILAWRPDGAARIAALAVDLSRASTDFAASPLFPAFISELIASLAPHPAARHAFLVGEPISIELPPAASFASPLTDSRGNPVRIITRNDRTTLLLEPAAAPGFIAVTDASGVSIAHAAVNLDPRESDPAAIDIVDAAARLNAAGADWAAADPASPLVRRVEHDLWPALLAAAILLFAVESLVAAFAASAPRREAPTR